MVLGQLMDHSHNIDNKPLWGLLSMATGSTVESAAPQPDSDSWQAQSLLHM